MSQLKATFSGSVVAEPEKKTVGQNAVVEFPVYINHSKKNKDSGEYEPTGDTSKVRVTLWREKAEMSDVKKGDIVEISATLIEKAFQRKDGTEGRQIQTDYVESVVVKYRKDFQQSSGALNMDQWNSMISNAPQIKTVEDAPF